MDQYRTYMHIILLIAAVVSFAIGQWSTGAVLVSLTVLNAVVGLRQEGKAESAMNALKSLTKRIARVRRDGAEAQIPAEQVVIGDLVLLSAGDDVAADGRIISASSLDIDESALTGESTPASKTTDRSLTRISVQVTRRTWRSLTLWIGAAALVTMIVMFALGLSRGQPAEALFITAIALAIAAIPTALPTVLHVMLSACAKQLAGDNAIVKELVSVETLGSDLGDQLRQDRNADDEPDDGRRRACSGGPIHHFRDRIRIGGKVHHAVGASPSIDEAVLPFIIAATPNLRTANGCPSACIQLLASETPYPAGQGARNSRRS